MKLYTVDEFLEEAEPFNDYIIRIRQKYDHEKEYEFYNVICEFDCVTENFILNFDLNEGQSDCYVVDFINVDDIFTEIGLKWLQKDIDYYREV